MEGIHILLIVGAIVLIFIISTYNGLVNSYKKVERSKSLVDIFLKKRFDLIPNLIETVKAYSKYEEDVLEKITSLRNSYSNKANDEDAKELNKYYQKCIALVESYPDLKASENYLNLQDALIEVEDEIQASRRIYSTDIMRYNTKIQTFPTNIFASIFGYKAVEPLSFEVDDVKVSFDK